MLRHITFLMFLAAFLSFSMTPATAAESCDKACLESMADQYRAAYRAHDPSMIPVANDVMFVENNIEMPFPEGTWDTVTEELGPALTLSDPFTGNVTIFTAIMQNDVPTFLAIRLKIGDRKIREIEHILATERTLSGPPTPMGDVTEYVHDPVINETIPPEDRLSRKELVRKADGYYKTLARNDGEIRGTCFHDNATRRENGLLFQKIREGFESGRYYFNNRVRRTHFMVDEARGVVVSRGFIDHKGVLDEYTLTNGEEVRSPFREPHSWAFIEMFKVRDGCIDAVVAQFFGAPYYMRSPFGISDVE